MKKQHPRMKRRAFLKQGSLALGGTLLFGLPGNSIPTPHPKKTRVVLIRHPEVLDKLNRPRAEIVQEMIDRAVVALTGSTSIQQAWQQIVRPEDTVGIKSNVWRFLPTPAELEEAVVKRVREVGVAAEKISVNDRTVLRDPIFRNATALINMRPLRTHYWAGVGSLIKNYIMFVPNPSDYHPDTCADLATIWKLPHVRGRTRLNVLVMFTPLFHGQGPHHFSPQYIWPYRGLLVGFDPVAVDSVGVRILQAKRREYFGEERPLNPPPKHIFLADTRHHLGTADPAKIDLIKLGWEEGCLI